MQQQVLNQLRAKLSDSQGWLDDDASESARRIRGKKLGSPEAHMLADLFMPSPLGGISESDLERPHFPVSTTTIVANLKNQNPRNVQFGLDSLNAKIVRELLVIVEPEQTCEVVEALISVSEHSASRKMREHAAILANDLLVKLEESQDANK